MIHGFFRLKDRTDRRPGFPVETRFRHTIRRWREIRGTVRAWLSLILEMEELWLQTRKLSEAEVRLKAEMERLRSELNRSLRAAELHLAYIRARVTVPDLHVPSRISLAFRDANFSIAQRVTYTRADLKQFWTKTRERWRRHQFLRIFPHRIILHLMRDVQLLVLFAAALVRGGSGTADLRAWR